MYNITIECGTKPLSVGKKPRVGDSYTRLLYTSQKTEQETTVGGSSTVDESTWIKMDPKSDVS